MKKIIPMALGLLLLSGCTQPVTSTQDTSIVTPVACCTALNQLPVQIFNGKSSLKLNFDAQTPKISEDNSSVRAQVVALPNTDTAYTLEFTAPLTHEQFLAVQAVVYDADWKPLQKLTYKDFVYRTPAVLQSHRLFASMLVQPGMKAPRWLVISTVTHPEPDRVKLIPESTIYAEKTQVEAPLELTKYGTASETGPLTVRISRFSQLANEMINVVTGG